MRKTHPRTPNKELAAKVLRQITEHPETHNQWSWFVKGDGCPADTVRDVLKAGTCGTTGCVAGWAVALHYAHKKRVPDSTAHIEEAGARLLRLGLDEANWLFGGYRTHEQVVAALQRIVDGKPVLPA